MQQRFSITGMHCASCEIVIEDKLSKLPNVEHVDVSHTKGRVMLDLKDGAHLTGHDLGKACAGLGYFFTEEISTSPVSSSITPSTSNGSLPGWMRFGGVVVILFALYLILDRLGYLRFSPSVDNVSGFAGVFTIGLIAAFSSCAAIVGGLLTVVSIKHAERHPNASRAHKLRPHLLFNIGRLLGFTIFGALLGWFGQGLSISPAMNGFLILLIGIIMIGFGINLLGILPKGLPTPKPPKSLTRFIHTWTESEHPAVPFALGSATFFLPCGFTQSMQLYALSIGDPRLSALIMLVFALGTLPALLGIGWATSTIKGEALKKFGKVAGALIFILGLANLQNGTALLDWHLPARAISQATTASAPQVVGNKQVITMDVTSYGTYVPDTLTVVEGIPVEWNIRGADFMGCANSLILRAFNVSANLRPGANVVRFTPTKVGRYTFSCSMGMVRGTMNVIPNTN